MRSKEKTLNGNTVRNDSKKTEAQTRYKHKMTIDKQWNDLYMSYLPWKQIS
jgi:hypothetical protein